MSVLVVPTFAGPSYVQTTTLEGSKYVLQFNFNQRASCWYLDIADSAAVDIYNGIKLVCGIPLFRRCRDPRRPPGDFIVLSSTTDTSPPAYSDLVAGSGRCTLLYVTSDWTALLQTSGGLAAITSLLSSSPIAQGLSVYGST